MPLASASQDRAVQSQVRRLRLGAGVGLLMSAKALEAYHSAGLTGIVEIGPPIEVVRVGSPKP